MDPLKELIESSEFFRIGLKQMYFIILVEINNGLKSDDIQLIYYMQNVLSRCLEEYPPILIKDSHVSDAILTGVKILSIKILGHINLELSVAEDVIIDRIKKLKVGLIAPAVLTLKYLEVNSGWIESTYAIADKHISVYYMDLHSRSTAICVSDENNDILKYVGTYKIQRIGAVNTSLKRYITFIGVGFAYADDIELKMIRDRLPDVKNTIPKHAPTAVVVHRDFIYAEEVCKLISEEYPYISLLYSDEDLVLSDMRRMVISLVKGGAL